MEIHEKKIVLYPCMPSAFQVFELIIYT